MAPKFFRSTPWPRKNSGHATICKNQHKHAKLCEILFIFKNVCKQRVELPVFSAVKPYGMFRTVLSPLLFFFCVNQTANIL
jgi:hypothetical protein